jgi:hypothetical protein
LPAWAAAVLVTAAVVVVWRRRDLAVTGSLFAFVWIKAARAVGAQPDWRRSITRVGAVLVPLSLLAAAVALRVFAPVGI